MADETSEDLHDGDFHGDPDIVLTVLCSLADKNDDFRVSITVNVPGGTVSGLLVGPDVWFKELSAAYGGQLAGTVDPINAALTEARESVSEDDRIYSYIHLRDARFISGGGPMPNGDEGIFWRGRLAQVSGWAFGSIGS